MYVYLLQSTSNASKRYISATTNLKKRLGEHNAGRSLHTAKFDPWKIVLATWFEDVAKAMNFEKYLKSGSATPSPKRISGEDKSMDE